MSSATCHQHKKCHLTETLLFDMILGKLDFRELHSFFCSFVVQCWLAIILSWSFGLFYLISIIPGLLLLLAFFSGVIVTNVLWSNKSIHLSPLVELLNEPISHVTQQNFGCNVCGDNFCKRQKSVKDNQPWVGLNVPKEVDQAVQDLFNKVLNEFITSWHNKFTKDESFILELRRGLRYAASILLKRVLQVDIGEVITDQLLTTVLRHVNNYKHISKISLQKNIPVEKAAAFYLNKKLHPAVYNRKSELQYLRSLSELLSKYLIESSQLKCLSFSVLIRELLAGWVFLPLTDTLSDPYCINSLLLLALSYEPLTVYSNNSVTPVQFLNRFVMPNKDLLGKKSAFQTSFSVILKDQKLLYTFMQFLKKEGVVHLLQFCLDVEEFSKKILNPELGQAEMETLHKEASNLFSVYFKTDSPDNIHFPKHIVQQMEQVLDGGASNISKLRTSPALFKAYEIAYSILEETYCPLFYMSDDFFPLLCGERQKATFTKDVSSLQPGSPMKGRNIKKPSEPSAVGKLSNKFHKLLQFQAVEGKAYFEDIPLDVAETECAAEDMSLEITQDVMFRDMSTWRVTVPSVITKQDSNSKPYPVFIISVVDIGTKDTANQSLRVKWNVERRYNDFYLLQTKLAEFHGEFEGGTQLPAKTGMFSPRGSEFLENRRQLFEDYLQKLLQIPNLRGSDLLYYFLHSPAEFSSCLSAQDGIGKIIRRSVEPIKLRKERGQHLENFLNVFLASTEGTKRSGKLEWQDIRIETKRKKRNITKSIFFDNFHEFLEKSDNLIYVQKEEILLEGPWDCIFYIMSRLMGASTSVIQVVMTFKNLLGQSSETVIKLFIRKKLESLLVPTRVSHLIRLLQDALFNSNYQARKQNHKTLRDKVLLEINKTTNNVLVRWFLPKCKEGVQEMVDSLQYPILNKHLCYCLLDEVIRVLFPELSTSN